MNKPLRKYHFVTWHLLAGLLPLIFVMAIVVRPATPLKISDDTIDLSATIDSHTDSTSVISINVGDIKGVSCVAIVSNQSHETVLTLNGGGVHKFIISKIDPPFTLKLCDTIHKRSITSIAFEPKN